MDLKRAIVLGLACGMAVLGAL